MSTRKKYHVTQNQNGTWSGKLQGGQRASVTSGTKAKTVSRTVEIAKNISNSQVIIHKRDGKFQEERTYGNDPYPPNG